MTEREKDQEGGQNNTFLSELTKKVLYQSACTGKEVSLLAVKALCNPV